MRKGIYVSFRYKFGGKKTKPIQRVIQEIPPPKEKKKTPKEILGIMQ